MACAARLSKWEGTNSGSHLLALCVSAASPLQQAHGPPPSPPSSLCKLDATRSKDRHALFRENRESTRPPLLIEIPFREPAADLFLIFGPRTTAGRQDHLRIPDIHLQSDNSAFCRIPYRYSVLCTDCELCRRVVSVANTYFALLHWAANPLILRLSPLLSRSLPPAPEPPLSDSGLDPL